MAKRRTTGNVRKRKDGRWEASVTIGYNEKGNPRRIYRYARTKKEAEQLLAELQIQHAQGSLVEPSDLTVGQWLDQCLRGKPHLSAKTVATYQYEVNHLKRLLGDIKLQALKPIHIKNAYIGAATQDLSPRTQRKLASRLTSALQEAVDLELLPRNPAKGVKIGMPRVKPRMNAWTGEEATAFLKAARRDPFYPLFYLMLVTGMRRGEVMGLQWRNVDVKTSRIQVTHSLSTTGKGDEAVLKEVKTDKSRRTLQVTPDVLEILEERRLVQREHAQTLGALWPTTDYVFTTALGTPISPRNLGRSFKRIQRSIDLKALTLHDLRHTYASLALQHGVPIELVSERLGHASVGFTLDTYRHVYDAERAKGAVSLGDLLNVGRDDDDSDDDDES